MIRHIVLFKLNKGLAFDDAEVVESEKIALQVGDKVPELREWKAGRNTARRTEAYDFAVIGLLEDADALARYMADPFHRLAIEKWKRISTWVVVDLEEDPGPAEVTITPAGHTGLSATSPGYGTGKD
ncbi:MULTISPECIES: Dabb family protein [unclassified Frankia]|uniref:Dabb family protein n=1 Tax=unclassified Frankia TaxID=2632575 RepID=UPI001EF65F81|nr:MULTISPECIES: Dabb family protein [unclassified Frankia]